jgi:hypothetical protein
VAYAACALALLYAAVSFGWAAGGARPRTRPGLITLVWIIGVPTAR